MCCTGLGQVSQRFDETFQMKKEKKNGDAKSHLTLVETMLFYYWDHSTTSQGL